MKKILKIILLYVKHYMCFYLTNKGLFSVKKLYVNPAKTLLKNCEFIVSGNNTIIIEDDCKLVGVRFFMTGENNTIHIGKRVVVNASCRQPTFFNACDGASIYVEDDCLFSNNIEFHTTDYHKIFVDERRTNIPADVVIRNNSWIGLRSIVLKGSEIPPHSIVGACSVVTKKFKDESNVVIAGNPAVIVRRNVVWQT